MPRYDYDCAACGRRFEATHGVFEDGPTACPLCGSRPVRKAFSPPTIHFKGSGWAKKERQASTASRASRDPASGSDGGTSGGSRGGEAASADASSDATVGAAETSRAAGPTDSSTRSDKPAKPAPKAATSAGGSGGD